MSSSPVGAIRSLQRAVKTATNVDVQTLALVSAICDQMPSQQIRLQAGSLQVYRDRLRNWAIADSTIFQLLNPIRLERSPTSEEYESVYEKYAAAALASGLTPLKPITFRQRAYDLPLARPRR